jgi:hypothetical protein
MFLGYRITSEGVCIDNSRINSLKNYPKPTKAKNVKEYLGLTDYYRQFIKNYADIVDPLNNLTRKNVKFTWWDKCDHSFHTLIKYLSEKPILAFPNFDAPFYLYITNITSSFIENLHYGWQEAKRNIVKQGLINNL